MTAKSDSTKIELILQKMGFFEIEMKDIKTIIKEQFVTKPEFQALDARLRQLERYFYGFIGLIVVMVVTAIVGGVIVK